MPEKEGYAPLSCFHCNYDIWANNNYCRKNKRLKTEKYFKKRHPKCPLDGYIPRPKIKIKKGFCLIIVTDKKENLCKNCFFYNPHTQIVKTKNVNIAYSGCLRSSYMDCPSKAHKGGLNMIFKSIKIKEAKNA